MSKRPNPFNELEQLFEQMQQNFQEAAEMWRPESARTNLPGAGSVQIDLEETEDTLVLTADLPGFTREDIDLSVKDRMLRLDATHEEESEEEREGEYLRRERQRASVSRSITLPETVDTDAVSATYQNGVLTVEMDKREPETEETEIEIS
ncbi:Hsp20/alpha crystallin family protein [Halobacteriaceae archaeon SHR40]|uniref:Hsp20/alpha crystallin family protein n=1 Tax=Halovenus amylolytica TaxID=2500550 RepID=UPI000FE3560C